MARWSDQNAGFRDVVPFRFPTPLLLILAVACGEREPRGLTIPASPRRIVSLAPNLTEAVYAIGAQDRLVGVTQYCKFPPEARTKPKVGALVNLNYEILRALEPDLIIHVPAQGEAAAKLLRLGIPSLAFRSESIADIRALVEKLGDLLDRREAAKQWVEQSQERMRRLRADIEALRRGDESAGPENPPPRVLIVVGRNPGTLQQIYACGSGNYLNELIQTVGAVNVLGVTPLPWPVISKEAIVKLDPDVILDGSIREGDAPVDGDVHMRAWNQLSLLSAVRKGRVVAIGNEHLLIPGPGFVDDAFWLARAIHGPAERSTDPNANAAP